MAYAVTTTNLCKRFSLQRERTTLFRVLQNRLLGRARGSSSFYALRDISITVQQGEKIGVIGDNGSGKTTLLKCIAGLHVPNEGQVLVNGSIGLSSGFGIGMVPELTARENVFLYGAVYGMDRREIQEAFSEIIDWAELQDFVAAPLKTLSSGMKTRLAFSVARHVDTDILLLDEALTAGDRRFKQKCQDYFAALRQSSKTFLVATHDLDFVETFCAKTLWLHRGQQMAFGETQDVLQRYTEFEVIAS